MLCKDCHHSNIDKGVCSKRHIRIAKTSVACDNFTDDEQFVADTHTCQTCKFHYIPDKSYPNIHLYYDYKGEFFLCKCKIVNYI